METTEKRTVEQIVEGSAGSIEATASWVYQLQCDASNFLEQYRDPMIGGIDWNLIEGDGLPRPFVDALKLVAEYEVRL